MIDVPDNKKNDKLSKLEDIDKQLSRLEQLILKKLNEIERRLKNLETRLDYLESRK